MDADSAFCNARHSFFLIKYVQNGYMSVQIVRHMLKLNQATLLRQTPEWGMHGFHHTFPRLKNGQTYEIKGERTKILLCTINLSNFRTRFVGLTK